MSVSGTTVDACQVAKLCHEFVGTSHGAGKSAANTEVEFARSLLPEAGIESDNLYDLDRGDVEFLGDPFNGFGADEAVTVLNFVEERENCGPTLVVWILGDSLVRRFFERRCDLEWRKVHFAGRDR